MKKHLVTKGIVLRRTEYGEADRIVVALTKDYGKLTFFVRGARKPHSKLASGIELFAIAEYTVLPGKKALATLISARISEQFHDIVHDYDKTMYAYTVLRAVNAATEAESGSEYYYFLFELLHSLTSASIPIEVVQFWANMHLLTLGSMTPNLSTDSFDNPLKEHQLYRFDIDSMSFIATDDGQYKSQHIKLLRLCVGAESPAVIKRVRIDDTVKADCAALARHMASEQLHIEL